VATRKRPASVSRMKRRRSALSSTTSTRGRSSRTQLAGASASAPSSAPARRSSSRTPSRPEPPPSACARTSAASRARRTGVPSGARRGQAELEERARRRGRRSRRWCRHGGPRSRARWRGPRPVPPVLAGGGARRPGGTARRWRRAGGRGRPGPLSCTDRIARSPGSTRRARVMRPAGRRELEGVGQEVQHHPLELGARPPRRAARAGASTAKAMSRCGARASKCEAVLPHEAARSEAT
jgi:hypothetical protein